MNKNILATIFDFSFSEFATTRIIRLLFILAIAIAGLWSLFILSLGLASKDAAAIVISLIVAPMIFFIMTLASRVLLEIVIVTFRIAENTARLVKQGEVHKDSPAE